jgi:hypothetical protein
MKKIILLLIISITACHQEDNRLENPMPADIQGKWEALALGKIIHYGLLSFDSNGNGVFIASSDEEAGQVLKLENFVSKERSFLLSATLVGEEEREDFDVLEGEIVQGILCFHPAESDEQQEQLYCFARYEEINKYRKIADEALSKIN